MPNPGPIPTVTVVNRKGHVMNINVGDFDPKLHKRVEAVEAPHDKPDTAAAISAATTIEELRGLAKASGLMLHPAVRRVDTAKARLLEQL